MMKVEEAKKKVCPFIESAFDGELARDDNEWHKVKNVCCICGDCMAWQYTIRIALTADKTPEQYMSNDTNTATDEGYCMRLKES